MFTKVVTGLCFGMTLIFSNTLYANSISQNVDDFNKVGAKVIKNLEANCENPKTVYQYWDVIEVLNLPIKEREYRDLAGAQAIYMDISLFAPLDFKSHCNLAVIDNQIAMLIYKRANVLKDENYNRFVATIEGRLVALLLIKELFNEKLIIDPSVMEVVNNYIKSYENTAYSDGMFLFAFNIYDYISFFQKRLSYDEKNIRKISLVLQTLFPFYDYLNEEYNKNLNKKSFIVGEVKPIVSAMAERAKYEGQLVDLILALKNNDTKFLNSKIKNYVDLYDTYDDLAIEYNQRNNVEYGFDGAVRKEDLSTFIALGYARLKNIEEAKKWSERADLININSISCEKNQIVEDAILDNLLKMDSIWYKAKSERKPEFCEKKERLHKITEKFKNYDILIQRVEKNCNNPSQYGYTNILKNKNSSAVNDIDFYVMLTSDEMLKSESIELGSLTTQCKEAVLTNNKEILKFYVENMPADAWYYNEAKESLAKLE